MWLFTKIIQFSIFPIYPSEFGAYPFFKEGVSFYGDRLDILKKVLYILFSTKKTNIDMDVESNYFKEMKNARFEKLKMLAS